MAVAFGNITAGGVQDNEGSIDIVCSKPTGLAEGDLMIFVGSVALGNQSEADAKYTRTDWEDLGIEISAAEGLTTSAIAKVADSSDEAASTFSFSNNISNVTQYGVMFYITGNSFGGVGNISIDIEESSADSTPTYSGGVTPIASSSLLVMVIASKADNLTASNYAVANNNPTWTERFDDFYDEDTAKLSLAVASGSYASAGSTGNYSATLSSVEASIGILMSIGESQNSTFNADPLVLTGTLPNQTVTGDANFTPDPLVITATLPTETHSQEASRVTNKDKNSASTIVNKDKS